MPEGQFDAAVGSPPYSEGLGHGGQPTRGAGRTGDNNLDAMQRGYGAADGQLANMPEGAFDIGISSPPFTGVVGHDGGKNHMPKIGNYADTYGAAPGQLANMAEGEFAQAMVSSPGYGGSELSTDKNFAAAVARDRRNGSHLDLSADAYNDGNVSGMTGDTFWSAAAVIVAQTYAALRPGAHAVFVLKRFVRD